MTQNKPLQDPKDREDVLPKIVVPMVVCPHCGSEEKKTRSSRLRPDGTRASYCQCQQCDQRYCVIHEPPKLR